MRTLFIGAFGPLLLSASLAHGQASQPTSATDVTREVISATSVTVKVADLDKVKPTFTARTTTVGRQQTVLDGKVVALIEDTRITADRAVVGRDGEITFDGNVRIERAARTAASPTPSDSRPFRFAVGKTF